MLIQLITYTFVMNKRKEEFDENVKSELTFYLKTNRKRKFCKEMKKKEKR